jgi:hypothetical protein
MPAITDTERKEGPLVLIDREVVQSQHESVNRRRRIVDVWCEAYRQQTRIVVACAFCTSEPFWTPMLGGKVLFVHFADVKHQRLFEASEWRPADDRDPASPGLSLRLEGPFPEGTTDVS